MEIIIFALVFLTILLYTYAIASCLVRDKVIVLNRLGKIARKTKRSVFEEQLSQPILKRVVKPVMDDISKIIYMITPKAVVKKLEKKILVAGTPYNLRLKEWTGLQGGIMVLLPLITILVAFLKSLSPLNVFFVIIAELLFALMIPGIILNKKIKDRKLEILKFLPEVIDYLTVSVEAGLAFDSALAKVTEKIPGQTSAEFNRVLQEVKMGKSKKIALKEMAERIDIPEMTTFISAVVQSEQLGVSIGSVLRVQSEQIRQKRRQRVQEKAMKAPIKMLIPMVLFIFPTIFTVLLGPVIIRLIDMFANK